MESILSSIDHGGSSVCEHSSRVNSAEKPKKLNFADQLRVNNDRNNNYRNTVNLGPSAHHFEDGELSQMQGE